MNGTKHDMGCAGVSSTSALVAFGHAGSGSPAYLALAEEWDGSTWTEVADGNTARSVRGGGFGTTEAMIVAGGEPGGGPVATTESWNGTAWSEINNIGRSTSEQESAGTQ